VFLEIDQSQTRIACRKHPWKVLYKDWSFSSDPLKNIAAIGILVSDWMISFQRRILEINQPETRIAYGSNVC
jgi:hypothetical protein